MRLLAGLSAILLLAYPFVVYFGIDKFGLKAIALVLLGLFAVRILFSQKTNITELKSLARITGGLGIVLLSFGYLFNETGWLTYYPVAVSVCLFLLFFSSLWKEQSIIERLARLQDPDLPESGVRYTRNVTKIWCVFFVFNGSIALVTCFLTIEIWTLYNGLISYILMGMLFAAEFLVRINVKKKSQ